MKWPFLILVKYATRGRKERFFGGMETIYKMASQPDFIYTVVTADEDDMEMNSDEVKERIKQYPNTSIIYGSSKNKIHAINRDMDILPEAIKNWDILVNFSDDQRFVTPMWDDYIRVDMNAQNQMRGTNMDMYLAYLDPDTKGVLSTTLVAGRKFIDRFNFIYDPQFQSLFCDNLMEDCAKALGRYNFTGMQLVHHYNPSYGYAEFPPDAMYEEQQKIGWDIDEKLYYKIKGEGIDKYLQNFIK